MDYQTGEVRLPLPITYIGDPISPFSGLLKSAKAVGMVKAIGTVPIIFAAALLLFAVPAYAVNLLTNGNFETGEWATNWTKNVAALPDGAFVVQNSTVYAGTCALQISTGKTSGYNAGLYQNVSVTGGNTYTFKG